MSRTIIQASLDRGAHSDAYGFATTEDTKVQQHLKTELDINTIVARFGLTGQAPVVRVDGMFGDFTGVEDLRSALERVDAIRDRFMLLPPEVRERFANDPLRMAQRVQEMSPEELEEALTPRVAAGAPPEAGRPKAPAPEGTTEGGGK